MKDYSYENWLTEEQVQHRIWGWFATIILMIPVAYFLPSLFSGTWEEF